MNYCNNPLVALSGPAISGYLLSNCDKNKLNHKVSEPKKSENKKENFNVLQGNKVMNVFLGMFSFLFFYSIFFVLITYLLTYFSTYYYFKCNPNLGFLNFLGFVLVILFSPFYLLFNFIYRMFFSC